MSDLYNDAVTAACESTGITRQHAANIIDPFLVYIRENMWNYGFGESEPIIDVLRIDPSGDTK